MRRVFAVAVLKCPRCAGPLRILTAIHPPTAPKAESVVEEFDFGA
jgi:hypothetical protein